MRDEEGEENDKQEADTEGFSFLLVGFLSFLIYRLLEVFLERQLPGFRLCLRQMRRRCTLSLSLLPVIFPPALGRHALACSQLEIIHLFFSLSPSNVLPT